MTGTATPPDWSSLTDGYREFHDPRPLVERIRKAKSLTRCWETIWERMHHQGDVGEASYAIVPALIEVYAGRARTWEIYSYAALMEECREETDNPEMPDWLKDEYDHALVRLRDLAFEDLRSRHAAGMLSAIFAFLAAQAGSLGLSVAIHNLGDNEVATDDLARYGESLNDF